jgi:rod shape-determining protein MreC
MAAFWRRNRAFIALTVATLVLTGLIVATAGDENMSGFEKYTAGALAPVQEAIARMVEFIRGFAENVGELRTLAADFRQQQSELEALRLQFNYLVEVKRENERLLQMLNYTQTTPQSRYVMARVIAYAPVSWQQEIVIDRGENDGITTGMAVITSTGLVGRVYETTPTTAKGVSG